MAMYLVTGGGGFIGSHLKIGTAPYLWRGRKWGRCPYIFLLWRPPTMEFIDLKAQQSRIRQQLERRISKVLDHGWYIMGPEVKELEAQLAALIGVGQAIGSRK